ncbi:hypothetical protein CJD36_019785 [Flavipsychrobacter stenotrophus]|uniref:Uncharacterized protein n=1 Tax=Flavipsychrobacter stenotrophus TaxID=2077091 RepID=A0A2S7SRE8_9BACT|nr:T9SS type A sorting domain-containing protein [Flavipsychrobacter stenotrophus]PQJ09483.1 hypothetical protein CJD36_019785 [Flavipsychrobacter stenotrophus]
MKKIILASMLCLISLLTYAQAGYITTIAGTGTAGYTGNGVPATTATIDVTTGMAIDGTGNIFISDLNNHVVRKINTSGIITTIAGNGTQGFSGDMGPATDAQLDKPRGLACDATGNLYISDYKNRRIRKVSTSGVITTFAGIGTEGSTGDLGPATAAEFNSVSDLAFDGTGNLYVCDQAENVIRVINTSGYINAFAGDGTATTAGDLGPATAAGINSPTCITIDGAGNLLITQFNDNRIRKVNTSGVISTLTGTGSAGYTGDGNPATGAQIDGPIGITCDATGNIYFSDAFNYVIRQINTSGIISTYAGSGTAGFSGDGGLATAAQLGGTSLIRANSSGSLALFDGGNHRIRLITADNPPSFIGGSSQTLTVCQDASATSINTLLAITEPDAGQTETWSVTSGPAHGSLSAAYSTVSTGSPITITPTGLTYTPTTGYSGTDAFTVEVTDGIAVTSTTITVTINPPPTVAAISGSSTTLCAGSNLTLTDATPGGTWSSGTTAVATVNSSGMVHGLAGGTTNISYSVANSCGTTYVAYVITVIASPNAGTLSGTTSVCRLESTTLTPSGDAGGTWSASNTTATVVGGVVTGGAGVGNLYQTDTITYAVTNSCGTSVATKAVIIRGIPYRSAGTSSICVGRPQLEVFSPSGVSLTAVTATGCSAVISGTSMTITATVVAAPCITITFSLANSTATVCHDTIVHSYNSSSYPITLSGSQYVRLGNTISLGGFFGIGYNWTVSPSTSIGFLVSGSVVSGVSSTGTVTISPSASGNVGDQAIITVTRTNGCLESDTQKVEIICPTCKPANETELLVADVGYLEVYPNPGSGKFTISLPSDNSLSAITITDLAGKIIATRIIAKDKVDFDLSNYPRGMYIINVTAGEKKYREKVLIE